MKMSIHELELMGYRRVITFGESVEVWVKENAAEITVMLRDPRNGETSDHYFRSPK